MENGSNDRTVALGQALAENDSRISIYSLGEPNYGKALREGILKARGEYVICDEIDLCDVDFYDRAIEALDSGLDLVVGSKRAAGARDRRPMYQVPQLRFSMVCYGSRLGLEARIPTD